MVDGKKAGRRGVPGGVPGVPVASGGVGADAVVEEAPSPRMLTDRELVVLGLLAQGLTNSEINVQLAVGENTAKMYVHQICVKLQARSRAHCVHIGYQRGLLKVRSRRRK